MGTIVCAYCGRKVPQNRRLKHLKQRYCNATACQRSRKLDFERKKYHSNDAFKEQKLKRCHERKKQSRQKSPQYWSEYQRVYRQFHPQYVKDNKEKQRFRYRRSVLKTHTQSKIVNPDTLMPQIVDNDKVYAMIKIDYKMIVNPDALIAQSTDILSFTKDKVQFVRLL